jgi:hypothetical protein
MFHKKPPKSFLPEIRDAPPTVAIKAAAEMTPISTERSEDPKSALFVEANAADLITYLVT